MHLFNAPWAATLSVAQCRHTSDPRSLWRQEIELPVDTPTAFVCYSHEDREFALRLANDLRANGAQIWMDKLDIRAGQNWDTEVEKAVDQCARMIVVLSPDAVGSEQVKNEFMAAIKAGKEVIPVFFRECRVPLQLGRRHYADFRSNYAVGLEELLASLGSEPEPMTIPAAQPREPAPTISDGGKKLRELSRLAESGDDSAMVELGDLCRDGEVVVKDRDQALTWYRRAAAAGNATGMYRVGLAYHTGQGVQPDHFQAVTWYRKAAEKGEPYGMFNLASMYEFGHGVEKDYEQARKWYEKSASVRPQDVEGALERIAVKEAAEQARLDEQRKQQEQAEAERLAAVAEATRKQHEVAEAARLAAGAERKTPRQTEAKKSDPSRKGAILVGVLLLIVAVLALNYSSGLLWIMVGLIVGWATAMIKGGGGGIPVLGIFGGIIGAVVSGTIARVLGLMRSDWGFYDIIVPVVGAIIGAVVVTWLVVFLVERQQG